MLGTAGPHNPEPSTLSPGPGLYVAASHTWRFMGSYKQGYKSPPPDMGYKYSYPTYNPTYNYP